MKTLLLLGSIIMVACLSACSSINSLQPFDQKQATILLQQQGYKPAPQK